MDDGQSDSRSGTMFRRVKTGSQASKFTDTSMVRVVDDEYNDEENYLKSLEEPSEVERILAKQPSTNTNQLSHKMQRRLTGKKAESEEGESIERMDEDTLSAAVGGEEGMDEDGVNRVRVSVNEAEDDDDY